VISQAHIPKKFRLILLSSLIPIPSGTVGSFSQQESDLKTFPEVKGIGAIGDKSIWSIVKHQETSAFTFTPCQDAHSIQP
jgi:hypothetical protein